jgi:hypothetical protein
MKLIFSEDSPKKVRTFSIIKFGTLRNFSKKMPGSSRLSKLSLEEPGEDQKHLRRYLLKERYRMFSLFSKIGKLS